MQDNLISDHATFTCDLLVQVSCTRYPIQMKNGILLTACLSLVSLLSTPAQAGESPVVVELFTSQSCYSCPPAEAYLAEIADQEGVLALEFHVDYWNTLVYGFAGRWEDPFSKAEYTQRQRIYNVAIRRSGQVYTPQAVIDGRHELVGSHKDKIARLIRQHSADPRPRVGVDIVRTGGSDLEVRLAGAADAAKTEVWLLRFLKRKSTQVPAGENKGKTLENAHIVSDVRSIGIYPGTPTTLKVSDFSLDDGEDCAVLVQSADLGPIMGAARCPAPQS